MRSEALQARAPGRTIGGYRVCEEIGRGAMSVVYRATRDDRSYALKVMEPGVDPVEARLLFRREATTIARLDHPGLVRVFEVGETDGRPYMVLDLAEGDPLSSCIAKQPLTDDQVIALGRSLAGALSEVHRHGLVHRDVKPSNIIRSDSGEARLIDFGLASHASDTDTVVGTLRYAAPEQLGVLNRRVGAPADLYALGVTLYEALTGRPPFSASNDSELLHAVATCPAPDLRDVCPGVRPALAAIIARLLKKDPDDRYQSAHGLLADLLMVDHFDRVLRGGRQIALGANEQAASHEAELPLIGRESELDALKRAYELARRGRFAAVVIEGDGGSGKTRLARELIQIAGRDDALIVAGKCNELETTPLGPLREAADRYAAHILRMSEQERTRAAETARHAAGEWGALVCRLSPGLARVLGDNEQIRPLEPHAEQNRFYEAIGGFFRGLASQSRPVVLLIDDAQWMDDGSLRVIERIAMASGSSPFLLVVTSRNGPAHRDACDRLAANLKDRLAARVVLERLGEDAIQAMISVILGSSAVDAAVIQRLDAVTQGNPFAIRQYLRTLLDQGILRPHGQGWRADIEALESIQLPRDVFELVVRRLHALGDEAAHLAGAAAVLGGRFSAELLGTVAGLEPQALGRVLDELVDAGLIDRSWGDQFAFVHDRVRESALERLSEAETRTLHQRAAEALDRKPDRSTVELYALARHYAAGEIDKDPRRAGEVNLEAGLRALEDHANEAAFEILDRALEALERAGAARSLQLLEGLGRACAMTGRLDRAFEHLHEALTLAGSKADRFRLWHLLTLTYASQGRNDEALEGVLRTFKVLGRPFPRGRVLQILSLLGFWLLALLLRWTGIGYGRAKGEARERRRTLSQLHYTGSMVSLFQGDPVLMVQFVVRDFYNVHFLGRTPETAVATSLYGAVMGMLQLRRAMRRHTRQGVLIAEQLGDRAAIAVAHAYEAMGVKWSGELPRGNALLEPALAELHRYAPGSWYAAMMIAEQAYSYLHAGHTQAAIAHCRANLDQLERTNNLMYRWNTLSVLYAELMVSGDVGAAAELRTRLDADYAPLGDTLYVKLAKVIADLEVMTDQEEVGPEVEETIALFRGLASEDYYSTAGRMLVGYARLHQLEKSDRSTRKQARKQLRRAVRALRLRAMVPVFRCHSFIWRAALARHEGRLDKARKLLIRAERLARAAESRRGLYHVALERARLSRAAGDGISGFHAQAAIDVATSERWGRKADRIRKEFELDRPNGDSVTDQLSRMVASPSARSVEQTHRYAQALLQVSLASVSTLDVDELAESGLTELAKVLGAERALFFTVDADGGELTLRATFGPDCELISRSVVERVVDSRAPVILTGSDAGEELGSESIFTHGLRSIIAAPVMLRERLLGVVYLDSRLAKGIFTADDVALLRGVSNHIAIALETARVARSEAERLAMQRDLDLAAAVQRLVLPKTHQFRVPGLVGTGFSQPASRCGGDWWWYEVLPDETLMLLVGDVSGHGAGAAMVTSAVAGAFFTMRRRDRERFAPAEMLEEIGALLSTFEDSNMTMAAVHIDPRRGELRLFSAASPGIMIRSGGDCRSVIVPGRVLGDRGEMELGEATVALAPGDRVLVSSDGLFELKHDGVRPLGPRRVAQLLAKLADVPISDVPLHLRAEVQSALQDRPQEDDITCVVIEMTQAA